MLFFRTIKNNTKTIIPLSVGVQHGGYIYLAALRANNFYTTEVPPLVTTTSGEN